MTPAGLAVQDGALILLGDAVIQNGKPFRAKASRNRLRGRGQGRIKSRRNAIVWRRLGLCRPAADRESQSFPFGKSSIEQANAVVAEHLDYPEEAALRPP